ncbi:uncharacterized protein BJ171DRAFT_507123 [Polychytrium aggregatum]|uniref:uncharacterized protein n=1 Tax=Polychytrium aggregatum TaxID=110093 RepID=UPI0022FEFE7A|nr:uncharacterized protein BJ171DRAFT_507123 [Polychytrium aggregatum]KAI9203950.1 hypothetical protein BJ171DRAFT_507123 [Polychytrium aggregatum]
MAAPHPPPELPPGCPSPYGWLSGPVEKLFCISVAAVANESQCAAAVPFFPALDEDSLRCLDDGMESLTECDEPKCRSQLLPLLLERAVSLAVVMDSHTWGQRPSETIGALQQVYWTHFEWLGPEHEQAMRYCWERYAEGSVHLALLVLCTRIERLLGDVIASSSPDGVPFLLREILLSPVLQGTLSRPLLNLLYALVGTPDGMNVRNVLWHGFVLAPAIDYSERCYFVLLWVVFFKIIEEFRQHGLQLAPRPSVSLDRYFPQGQPDAQAGSGVETSIDPLESTCPAPFRFVLIPESARQQSRSAVLQRLLCASAFPLEHTKPMWSDSFSRLDIGDDFGFLVLSLPLLEQALRRIYISANQLSPERLCATNEGVFYILLDDMLKAQCDGCPNQLISVVGRPTMGLLRDLFSWPDGPRIRDRLSHGEAATSAQLAKICVAFETALALLLLKSTDPDHPAQQCIFNSIPITALESVEDRYCPQYHPLAKLQARVEHGLRLVRRCIVLGHEVLGLIRNEKAKEYGDETLEVDRGFYRPSPEASDAAAVIECFSRLGLDDTILTQIEQLAVHDSASFQPGDLTAIAKSVGGTPSPDYESEPVPFVGQLAQAADKIQNILASIYRKGSELQNYCHAGQLDVARRRRSVFEQYPNQTRPILWIAVLVLAMVKRMAQWSPWQGPPATAPTAHLDHDGMAANTIHTPTPKHAAKMTRKLVVLADRILPLVEERRYVEVPGLFTAFAADWGRANATHPPARPRQ